MERGRGACRRSLPSRVLKSTGIFAPSATTMMVKRLPLSEQFFLTFLFANCTFFPMHILGQAGLRRRIFDPTITGFEANLQPLNVFISVSALLMGASQIIFIVNFFWSLFRGREAGRNPWHSNTLEWTTTSPAPHGNFEVDPLVRRGPYEYGALDVEEDYLPQTRSLPGQLPSSVEPEHH